jgi:SOS-response transcriptional repressor LexA
VLLEIKGAAGEVHAPDRVQAKEAGARKWCTAVTNTGRYGAWHYVICRNLAELGGLLRAHLPGGEILPFRRVEPAHGEHYRTCVPLTSLRAAAGAWSPEQTSLEDSPDRAEEWITWDDHPPFGPQMFVARVHGRSMEPEIPAGSLVLFRPADGLDPEGRRVLARHSGIVDPETGGQFTVKVFHREQATTPDGGVRLTRIVLKPINQDFQPIVITPAEETEVRVIGVVVAVVGSMAGRERS